MQSFYTSLDYQDMMAVTGEDSEKFLQGQLTCELNGLAVNQSRLGAACNSKGRVFASFRLVHLEDDYILTTPAGIAEPSLAALKKYIPFYQAEMRECGEEYNRFGLAGEDAMTWLEKNFPALPENNQALTHEAMILLNISTAIQRYELWLPPAQDHPLIEAMQSSLPEGGRSDWELLDHEAGLFFLQPEDAELYTPEELNLDLSGFIDFDKGCYTGQEIVARMHYRGKAKKRLFRIQLQTDDQIQDKALINDQESTIGIVSNLLYLNNITYGLVTLKTGLDQDSPCWMQTAGGKTAVTITPLC